MDENVLTFNKTILNILSNFIPLELVVCDGKDPLWLNTKIKSLIHEKIKTYKVLRKNIENNSQNWETKVSTKLFEVDDRRLQTQLLLKVSE